MATCFSILAWKIPWTEGLSRLRSMGLQRVRHDWAHGMSTHTHTFFFIFVSIMVYNRILNIVPCGGYILNNIFRFTQLSKQVCKGEKVQLSCFLGSVKNKYKEVTQRLTENFKWALYHHTFFIKGRCSALWLFEALLRFSAVQKGSHQAPWLLSLECGSSKLGSARDLKRL